MELVKWAAIIYLYLIYHHDPLHLCHKPHLCDLLIPFSRLSYWSNLTIILDYYTGPWLSFWSYLTITLVRMKRPITSLDFCYSGETETVSVQVLFNPRNMNLQIITSKIANLKLPNFQIVSNKIAGVCFDLRNGGSLRLWNNPSQRDVDRPWCNPSTLSQTDCSR